MATPTNLRSTSVHPNKLTLAWDGDVGGAFDVEENGIVVATALTSTSLERTGLTQLTDYEYRVRAHGSPVGPLRFNPYSMDTPVPGVNIGVISGVPRATHIGNLVLDSTRSGTVADPTIIEDLDITGRILWTTGSNIIVRNCRVLIGPCTLAPTARGNFPGIQAWGTTGSNVVFEDIEITASHPDAHTYGIHGHGWTMRRFWIHDVVDGIVTFSTRGSLQEGGLVENILWYAYDPNQTDGTHNDPWQMQGGTAHRAIGVTYDNGPLIAERVDGQPGAGFSILGTQDAFTQVNSELGYCTFKGSTEYSTVQYGDSGRGAWTNPMVHHCSFLSTHGTGAHGHMRVSPETKLALTFTDNTGPGGVPLTIDDVKTGTDLR